MICFKSHLHYHYTARKNECGTFEIGILNIPTTWYQKLSRSTEGATPPHPTTHPYPHPHPHPHLHPTQPHHKPVLATLLNCFVQNINNKIFHNDYWQPSWLLKNKRDSYRLVDWSQRTFSAIYPNNLIFRAFSIGMNNVAGFMCSHWIHYIAILDSCSTRPPIVSGSLTYSPQSCIAWCIGNMPLFITCIILRWRPVLNFAFSYLYWMIEKSYNYCISIWKSHWMTN